MLKTRVIPTLLYRDFTLVKGVRFDSRRVVGSPVQAVQVYNLRNVDELVFLDVTATLDERRPDFRLIDEIADHCFMPLCVGGGVRDVDDVRDLLAVGADKVALNTVAVEEPDVVRAASDRFGAQCIVVAIDTKTDAHGASTVWIASGSHDTGLDPVIWAKEIEALGAGEILLQSIDHDGVMDGYDLDTIARVSEAVSIPVIASGGAGEFEHLHAAIVEANATAVAAASMFHFTEQTPMEAKQYLAARGVATRC
jgi:imidazole glycerol-phosphate synthase subunit HisF